MNQRLPKHYKDVAGFCYVTTPMLATLSHLTPWNGEVDSRGFAVEATAPAEPAKPARAKKGKSTATLPPDDTDPSAQLDAVLNESQLGVTDYVPGSDGE